MGMVSARWASMKPWLFPVKAAIGLILLYVVLRNVDVGTVARILFGSKLAYFALSCLLLAAGVAVNALRWRFIMAVLGSPITLSTAMIGNFEAMFFNQILPTGVGGDGMRIIRVHDAGEPLGWSVVGVLLDRALGFWFVAVSIDLAAAFGGSAIVSTPTFRMLAWVSSVVLLGGLAAAVGGAVIKREYFPSWAQHLVTLTQAYTRVVRSHGSLLHVGGALLVSNIATIASFIMAARALGMDVGWWDATIVLQGMVLASIIPISIGGWGLREGTAILLFGHTGVGVNNAMAVAVLFGLVLTTIGVVGAVVWMSSAYRRFDRASDPLKHEAPFSDTAARKPLT